MTSFTAALSSIFAGITERAIRAEEDQAIAHTYQRVSLIEKTAEKITEVAVKAEAYKATSETHATLYNEAKAEIHNRLLELQARRGSKLVEQDA